MELAWMFLDIACFYVLPVLRFVSFPFSSGLFRLFRRNGALAGPRRDADGGFGMERQRSDRTRQGDWLGCLWWIGCTLPSVPFPSLPPVPPPPFPKIRLLRKWIYLDIVPKFLLYFIYIWRILELLCQSIPLITHTCSFEDSSLSTPRLDVIKTARGYGSSRAEPIDCWSERACAPS